MAVVARGLNKDITGFLEDPSTARLPGGNSIESFLVPVQTLATIVNALEDAAQEAAEGDSVLRLRFTPQKLIEIALRSGEQVLHLWGLVAIKLNISVVLSLHAWMDWTLGQHNVSCRSTAASACCAHWIQAFVD